VWVRDKELRATVIMPATAARAVDVLAEAFESGKAPSANISVDDPARSFPDLELIGTPDAAKSAPRILNARSRSLAARG
jgi:hypothetical protein